MSCYIHNVPGRLRIQSNKFKHNSQSALQLRQGLLELEGIGDVAHNPKSGSLIIQYDAQQLSSEDVLYQIHKSGLLTVCPMSPTSHPANRVGTLLGSALFGTLVKKSIESSVSSITKAIR